MKNPKVIIASGPVIVENSEVLLNQHGDTEFWKFCGGKIEDYSTDLIENARREAKEEMGIDLKILDENPFITHTTKADGNGNKIDVLLVHYLAEKIGKISPGEDIREWKWININDLDKENLAPNIMPALDYFGFIK